MSYGGEAADQIVRYSLEGTEVALKLTGTAAKNFAVFAAAVLKDQKKTRGKTQLNRLLLSGKPLKFFMIPESRARGFAREAKARGLLFVPVKNKKCPGQLELAVWAEDAAKVNRVLENMELDYVKADTGAYAEADPQPVQEAPVETEMVQVPEGKVAIELGEQEDLFSVDFIGAAQGQTGPGAKELLSGNSSEPQNSSPSADELRAAGKKPSVKQELGEIKEAQIQKQAEKKQQPQRQHPPRQRQKKKNKQKGR